MLRPCATTWSSSEAGRRVACWQLASARTPTGTCACWRRDRTTDASRTVAGRRTSSTPAGSPRSTSGLPETTDGRSADGSSAARPPSTRASSPRATGRTTTNGARAGRMRASSPTSVERARRCDPPPRTRTIPAPCTSRSSRRRRSSGSRSWTTRTRTTNPSESLPTRRTWSTARAGTLRSPTSTRAASGPTSSCARPRSSTGSSCETAAPRASWTPRARSTRAQEILLCAGAYFSPAILMRSGIGPEAELTRLGIPVLADLPTGARLLDHCGTTVAWAPSPELEEDTRRRAAGDGLFESHALVKAASSICPPRRLGSPRAVVDHRGERRRRVRGGGDRLPHEARVVGPRRAAIARSARCSRGRARIPLG